MVDLHTHSTASDGLLTPTALADLAHREGLTALALTDHDTTAGLAEATLACEKWGIRLVPGIELDIEWETGEFHLLGLGLTQTAPLEETIVDLQRRRHERNLHIFSLMQDAGLKGDYQEVQDLAGGGQVGRPHFARYLVQKGKVDSVQGAFNHFLGKGCLFYVKKAGLDFSTALGVIHQCGGLAVMAHPLSLYLSFTKLEEYLGPWKDQGLDGIEAWHPGATRKDCQRLEALAQGLGLKVSAGSDFHGDNRKDRRLGHTAGDQAIDEEIFNQLFAGEVAERAPGLPIRDKDVS